MAALGYPELHPIHGLDVRPVHTLGDIGDYMAKGGEIVNIGLELARADLKDRSLSPWSMLEEFATMGDYDALLRWQEYERATRGKKRIVWSNGLRDRLLGSAPEVEDEELAQAEGEDVVLVEVYVMGEEWKLWSTAGQVGELLRRIEETAAIFIFLAGFSGNRKGLDQ